jgi:hypothetical protein
MRVNIQKLVKVLYKFKENGREDIDLVILFNIARDLAVSNED